MIKYHFKITHSNKGVIIKSIEFPEISISGKTEDLALRKFFNAFDDHLNDLIKSWIKIPKLSVSIPKKKGYGSFGLPFGVECTLLIYQTMQEKNITKGQLASLLALSDKDINDTDWQKINLKSVKPQLAPKYKNVQRLLNVSHASTINEIAEAFRLMGVYPNISLSPLRQE